MTTNDGTPNGDRGQAILEFALAMPFLLAFIFFIVDCGLFAFSYVSLTNAVREGARCAAVGGTQAAVGTRVTTTYGGTGDTTVGTLAYDPDPAAIGGSVTVTANQTYEWITPIGLVPSIDSVWNYTKSATMRMETNTVAKATC
jgi:Flp pilus assembly protein TadG